MPELDYETMNAALAVLKAHWPECRPRGGIVLGSGWSEVATAFKLLDSIPYSQIPGLNACEVPGHHGKVAWFRSEEKDGLLFLGRRHYYETGGLTSVVLPIYLLKQLGAPFVFLTNAAGGIGDGYDPGVLMRIVDHDTTIPDPLIASYREDLGPRFPDQSEPYDTALGELLQSVANELNVPLLQGNYFANTGPSFETPARVNMLKQMGFQAFGMSTVPEATAANAWGLKVVGVSCISNLAAGISPEKIDHTNVNSVVAKNTDQIKSLISAFWTRAVK